MHPLDPLPLGFADRLLDLLQGLLLLKAIQHLLRARLDAKGQEIAVGLLMSRS